MKRPNPELEQAFELENREANRRNFTVGSVVGMVLVPLFNFLDRNVYSDFAQEFLYLRIGCSLAIGFFLAAVWSPFGLKHYRLFGVTLVLLPATTIAFMIYRVGGAGSDYYQGLNLVLLVVGFILRWTFRDSLIAVGLVILEYIAACYFNGNWVPRGENLNSYFFLFGTGIIVIAGNTWFTKLRYGEFQTRQALEVKKRELEASDYEKTLKQRELELSNTQLETTLKELKLAQDQLVQNAREKSRDEALTQISSGILHDVGNLMAPVANYVFKLKGMAPTLPEERRPNYLATLVKLERPLNVARGVLASLQRYAHAGPQMTEECSIRMLTDDALAFVRGKTEELGVQVTCTVDEAFKVLGHPVDLTMVIKNLLDNALQAIEVKGSADGPGTILIEGRVGLEHNELKIRDSGTGIPAESLKRIFEPYYTTNPGVGTGLGLPNCQRIMKALGGTIQVRTEVGSFTEFVLAFPNKVGATESEP